MFEVKETNTQYLNWIAELMPEDYRRVNAFAPFLAQIYEALEKNGYWADFGTKPFEPEQGHLWATRWLAVWQTDTEDEVVEAVKQDWRDYSERIIEDLGQVVKQADCARRHSVLMEFFIG